MLSRVHGPLVSTGKSQLSKILAQVQMKKGLLESVDLTQGTCVNGRELWLWESIHAFLTPLPRRLNLDLLELKHGEQTTEVDLMSSPGYTAHRLEGKHSCSLNTALTFRVTWGKNLLAPYTLVWAAAEQMGDSAARCHPHPLLPRPSLLPL